MADLLTPGFRFFPTEEELLTFYLPTQLHGRRRDVIDDVIPVLDIYCIEPWHLPKWSGKCCREDREQWFFFVPRQEREANGGRPSRTTATGYWKATGSITHVYSSTSRPIGVKKTMVFYKGKAPTGRKTKWKMNEYRAIEETRPSQSTAPIPQLRHEFSLCRVYVVSGSVRAFDRRPELQPPEPMAETVPESKDTVEVEEKASNSGNFPEIARSDSDWEMDEDFEKNLVEFEELEWPWMDLESVKAY